MYPAGRDSGEMEVGVKLGEWETSMRRPEDVRAPLLYIIETGLLVIRRHADLNDSERCGVEANHLHNLPSLVENCSPERLKYYLEVEVPQYIRETNDAIPGKVREAWNALRAWLR
jgi:hypothetical protein